MDSDIPSPNEESNEQKTQFRKLTNETAHRKYRRHSPMDKLSDEDGSPKHDHRARRNSKVIDSERRNVDRVDDRLSDGSRRSDSYRRPFRGNNRHDEQSKYGKHADEDDRSHRTGRDSRAVTHSDSREHERDYNRSRDRYRDVDRHSRDHSDVAVKKYTEKEASSDRTGYDGRRSSRYDDRDRYARDKDHRDDKRDYKSSRDHRSERTASLDDSVRQRSDYKSKWETDDVKDLGASKCGQDLKKDPVDSHGDELNIPGTKAEHSLVSGDTAAKRPKLFSSEDTETRKDQAPAIDSESVATVDAAKVAAMKAAELVNKNLTSTGLMTADQKKKLLWGSKKATTTEEPSNRWDSAMFSDRERQEKFNKLMTLRLPWYIWPIVGCERRSEDSRKTIKQPGCGETASRFGEAIHCWPTTTRWPYCGFRALKLYLETSPGTLSICLIYVHLYWDFVDCSAIGAETRKLSLYVGRNSCSILSFKEALFSIPMNGLIIPPLYNCSMDDGYYQHISKYTALI